MAKAKKSARGTNGAAFARAAGLRQMMTRVTPDELALVRAAAGIERVSQVQFVRRAAVEAARKAVEKFRKNPSTAIDSTASSDTI